MEISKRKVWLVKAIEWMGVAAFVLGLFLSVWLLILGLTLALAAPIWLHSLCCCPRCEEKLLRYREGLPDIKDRYRYCPKCGTKIELTWTD